MIWHDQFWGLTWMWPTFKDHWFQLPFNRFEVGLKGNDRLYGLCQNPWLPWPQSEVQYRHDFYSSFFQNEWVSEKNLSSWNQKNESIFACYWGGPGFEIPAREIIINYEKGVWVCPGGFMQLPFSTIAQILPFKTFDICFMWPKFRKNWQL